MQNLATTLYGHIEVVSQVAFLNHGCNQGSDSGDYTNQYIITSGNDKKICLWDVYEVTQSSRFTSSYASSERTIKKKMDGASKPQENGNTSWTLNNDASGDVKEETRCRKISHNPESKHTAMTTADFNGRTHYEYKNDVNKSDTDRSSNRYEVRLRVRTSRDGLQLMERHRRSANQDFLAAAIVDGRIQVMYNLGPDRLEGLSLVNSTVVVNDGQWHHLSIVRVGLYLKASVDHEPLVTALSTPGASVLNTNGLLYIAGADVPMKGLKESFHAGFIGCMRDVRLTDRSIDLKFKVIESTSISLSQPVRTSD